MIKNSFINEYADYDEMMQVINESNEVIDQAFAEYNYEMNQRRINAFVESSGADIYEEGVVNIIESIGAGIEKIFDKFMELIDKVADFFREKIWASKSDAQKLEALLKKHPDMKDEIKMAVQKGDLDVKDIKSMHDVMDGTYDILQKINKGEVEPSKAESMFNKVIDKFNKYGKPICEVIIAVGGAAAAVVKITSLHNNLMKNKIDKADLKNQCDRIKNAAAMEMDEKRCKNPTAAMRAKKSIFDKMTATLSKNVNGQKGLMAKVAGKMESLNKKYSDYTTDDARAKRDSARADKEAGYAKKASFFNSVKTGKSDPKHDDKELEWEKRKAQAQEAGKRADRDSAAGKNSARNTARAQQFGRDQVDEWFNNNGRSGRNGKDNKGWRKNHD